MAPRVDSNIHQLIHYPLASAIDFGNTYATFEQWEPLILIPKHLSHIFLL